MAVFFKHNTGDGRTRKNRYAGAAAVCLAVVSVILLPSCTLISRLGWGSGSGTEEGTTDGWTPPVLPDEGSAAGTADPVPEERIKSFLPEKEPDDVYSPVRVHYDDLDPEEQIKKLESAGLKCLRNESKAVLFGNGALVELSWYQGSVSVAVFVSSEGGAVSCADAVRIINRDREKMAAASKENRAYFEPFEPVEFASDVTPPDFLDTDGVRVFICPVKYSESKKIGTCVFIVGADGAAVPYAGDLLLNDAARKYYSYVFYDMDGDGGRDLFVHGPGGTSGLRSESFFVYRLGKTPSVIAGTPTYPVFSTVGLKLRAATDGRPVVVASCPDEDGAERRSLYTAELAPALSGEKDGLMIAFRNENGEPASLDVCSLRLSAQVLSGGSYPGGWEKDTDDRYVEEKVFEGYRNFVHDSNIDRLTFSRLAVFPTARGYLFLRAEGSDLFRLDKDGKASKERAGAYTLNLYTACLSDPMRHSRYVYPVGELYTEDGNIYKWDLYSATVSTFIDVKDRIDRTCFREGIIFYVTYDGKKAVLKAAPANHSADAPVFRIAEIPTPDPARIVGVSTSGAYISVDRDGVYFVRFAGGGTTKICGAPEGGFDYLKTADGKLYAAGEGTLRAYDVKGKELWSAAAGGCFEVYGDDLITLSADGIEFIHPGSAEPCRRVELRIGSLAAANKFNKPWAISNGKLYICLQGGTGDLAAVDLNSPEKTVTVTEGFFRQ